jgi:hypothetical protein
MNIKSWFIACCLGVLLLFPGQSAIALEAGFPNARELFQPMLLNLQMTGIPPQLPTYIPISVSARRSANSAAEKLTAYAHLDQDTPNGYQITLGYSPTCNGGNACQFGTVSAQRLTKGTPPIDEQYAIMKPNSGFKGRRSPELMASVALSQGIKGYFIPWICGANCNDAKVVWDRQGYRYIMGIKVGDKAELVAMANSAIENTIATSKQR